MQAVLFPAPETIAIEQVPEPTCAADEVIVEVSRCGICGTDLHIYRNEYMSDFPLIPGHEFGGKVVEKGRDVSDLVPGDRVAVDPNLYCGRCDFCRNEQSNHCSNWRGVGVTLAGGFAEYVAVPARACYRLPNCLSPAQMAFIEPVACVVYALQRLDVTPGIRALIFGAGPMGLLLLQALRHVGVAQVVVVEKQADRLQLAAQLGGISVRADEDLDERLEEFAVHGYDVVVDATGVPTVIEQAFDYLKPRGQFLQFGVTPRDARIQVSPYKIFRNDWTIVGSFALCYTFLPAIAWLESGVIDVQDLVSHVVPLADFASGFQAFADGRTLKVHVAIHEESG